jgi:hypothetical protein
LCITANSLTNFDRQFRFHSTLRLSKPIFQFDVVRPREKTSQDFRSERYQAVERPGLERFNQIDVLFRRCDGGDVIYKEYNLPEGTDEGSWIVWENMGAYTLAATTRFNGIAFNDRVIKTCHGEAKEADMPWSVTNKWLSASPPSP